MTETGWRLAAWIWVGGAVAGLALLLGGVGAFTGWPVLIPSLGPTVVLQVHAPHLPSSRPKSVLIGHGTGFAFGFLAVWMLDAGAAPAALEIGTVPWIRIVASAVALLLAFGAQSLLGAIHPPAAAATLLVTLGTFDADLDAALVILVGLAAVVAIGEPLRRLSARVQAR